MNGIGMKVFMTSNVIGGKWEGSVFKRGLICGRHL